MQTSPLLLTLLFTFSVAVECYAQERVFTNRQGKTITGSVETVSNGIVQIKIDNKVFEVPFQTLSDTDQAYLREWVANNYPYKFDLKESDHREQLDDRPLIQPGFFLNSPSRSEPVFKESSSRRNSIKDYAGYFRMVLSNRSGITAKNLKLEYRIISVLKYSLKGYRGDTESESVISQQGTLEIPHVAHTRSVTLETEKVYLPDVKWETTDVVRMTDGTGDNKPTDHRMRFDLHGLMVRLFDENGREIFSYRGPGKHMKGTSKNCRKIT